MTFGIEVVPGEVWRFEDLPAGTIALDGACDGPCLDPEGRRYSFDHHAGCIRLVTSATCQQVLDALLLGLDPSGMTVLVNDLDGDTVLSAWLLSRHERWRDAAQRERVRPLVASVGARDAHGPAYPVPAADLGRSFYQETLEPLRARAGRPLTDPAEARVVLENCLARLEAWWDEGLPVRPPDLSLPELPGMEVHGGYVVIPAGGVPPAQQGRILARIYEDGHDRALTWSRQSDGRYRYGLAKRSDLVSHFPLGQFYQALNAAEAAARGAALGDGQTWGGGTSIGGSPRDGSVLSPGEVLAVVGGILAWRGAMAHRP